jgi:hypothetical protein
MPSRSVLLPLASNRWWIYQKERFPVVKNSLLVALLSSSAVGYSLLLRSVQQGASVPELRPLPQLFGLMLLAFLALFSSFLQFQIAGEFKSLKQDVLYRPYRPISRGLVSLSDLRIIASACGLIQFSLALALGWPMLLVLLGVWVYFSLLNRDFFVPQWLQSQALLRLLGRVAMLPLLALYATAHDWLTAGEHLAPELGWFLLIGFFGGLAMELSHKIRAPQDEVPGVETYSALWGYRQAVLAWLIAVWLLAIVALQAGMQINFTVPVTVVALTLLLCSVFSVWRFWVHPTAKSAKRMELIAGLWMVGIYFNVAILPLLLHQT